MSSRTTSLGQTKTQAAYSAIRVDIETGVFPPGTRLLVGVLQERLGVSPTPVREALRMLQADGLVTNLPHQGMTVTTYAASDVEEVYRLREVVEPLASELVAEKSDPDVIAALQRMHESFTQAVNEDRQTEANELNAQWHKFIIESSGSRLIEEFCNRLGVVLPLRGLWLSVRAQDSINEHQKVLDAILAGDPEAARDAMHRHLCRGHQQTADRFATDGSRRDSAQSASL